MVGAKYCRTVDVDPWGSGEYGTRLGPVRVSVDSEAIRHLEDSEHCYLDPWSSG